MWPTRARGTCNSRAEMRHETTHAHTPVVLWAGIEALPGSDQYRQPLRCGAPRLIRALGEGFQHELEDRVVEPRDHDPVPGPGDLPMRTAHTANECEAPPLVVGWLLPGSRVVQVVQVVHADLRAHQ